MNQGPPASPATETLHLDPNVERAAKRARDRRFHVVELPRLRALGFAAIAALVALQGVVAPGQPLKFGLAPLALGLLVYATLSWFALWRWYSMEGRVHLGRLFLLLDMLPFAVAVWGTGGSASLLFVLPYVRVFDQVHIGLKWCLTCTVAASLTHAGLITVDVQSGVPVDLPIEVFKLTMCTLFALYLSLTSLTAESQRRRSSRTVALARDLVRKLQQRQAELERARRAAESAAVAKGAFLATMSHEIRTPMNGIIGMIELAVDAESEAERDDFLATARASANALLQIIGDVLDFSRLESGQLTIERTRIDVRDVVGQAAQLVGVLARPKGLCLTTRVEDGVPPVCMGDPLRTKQILINLLGNAVKFTERGGIRVDVHCEERRPGEPSLCFSVTDTGIGIAREQQASIFEAFTQAEMTTSRRFGGTGLGLSISHRLAELMGGTLGVTSTPGVGSTFKLSLPLERIESAAAAGDSLDASPPESPSDEAPGPRAPLPTAPKKPVRRESGHPMRILLVEDNPINQRVAKLQLERWGHEVVVAKDGAVAAERATQSTYDVILMDMQMPIMDGVEATRRIRAHDVRASTGQPIPIVAMTANVLEADRDRCLAAGMDDYISKPIQVTQLFDLLEALGAAARAA